MNIMNENNITNSNMGKPPKPPKLNKSDLVKSHKSIGKRIRNFFIIVLAIIVLFVVIVNLAFKLPVNKYCKISVRDFSYPDIYSDFIPQGVFYGAESGDIYLTGYMSDDTASPLYIIDKNSKKVRKKVRLLNKDGSPHVKHTSGLALYNGKIYITSCDDKLYVYDPAKIHETADDEGVVCEAEVNLNSGGDYLSACTVSVHGDNLVVSEFYKKGDYDTADGHRYESNDGTNYAYSVEMTVDDNYVAHPQYAYSIPDKAQGICFDNDTFYISESYGLSFSNIVSYNLNSINRAGTRNVLGEDIDFYVLDSDSMVDSLKLLPMSEEIEIIDDKMYVVCESASSKYIFGRLIGATKIRAIEMDKMK